MTSLVTLEQHASMVRSVAVGLHHMLRAFDLGMREPAANVWSLLTIQKQSSVIAMVESFLNGTMLEPAVQHAAWCQEMKRAGWTYSPITAPERKRHKQLLPFDQLPELLRRRHTLWRETATDLAIAVGLPSSLRELLVLYWPAHKTCDFSIDRCTIAETTGLYCGTHNAAAAFGSITTNTAFEQLWRELPNRGELKVEEMPADSPDMKELLKAIEALKSKR